MRVFYFELPQSVKGETYTPVFVSILEAIIPRTGVAIGKRKKAREFRGQKLKLGFRSRRIFTDIWSGASLNIPYSDFYRDPSAKTAALFRPRRMNGPASIFTRCIETARVTEARTRWFSLSPGGQPRNAYTERTKLSFQRRALFVVRARGYLSRPNERYSDRHFPLSLSLSSLLRDYVARALVHECKLNFRPSLVTLPCVNESLEQ